MARVYISFLGTNDYLTCTYFYKDNEVQNVRFVQEATLNFFCSQWTSEDRILIFATGDAYEKNWLDNGHKDRNAGKIKNCMGLKRCIESLDLPVSVQKAPIPEGKSEQEIWEIFQIVYDQLKPGDEVMFDITHAFRSIPMLAIVILNYAKTMKDVTLSGIYYGAFEVTGSYHEAEKLSQEKRRAPILDLTSFDQLMEWSFAVDRFLKAGDAHPVSSLAKKSVKPALMATKGQDAAAKTIRNIANSLEEFSKTLSTCRGLDITSTTSKLKQHINRCQSLELLQPFKPIFDRVKKQTGLFPGDSIADGIQAAKWCLEHNLVQQGYTLLQETLISYLLIKINKQPESINREIVGQAIYIYTNNKKLFPEEWKEPAKSNIKTTKKLIEFCKTKKELIEIYRNLSNDRNDLNHAGHKKNPMSADKFSLKLGEYIRKTEQQL
ncbi:MAG: TIGR02221 family CRISPR-associated protein [Thermodesulfobacteriota bacterium]|nr:TIGR02221 family CRISPR-associated protein [Thermodesulfobacteriota bacterium]